jgi:indoleamine 2,3-dioxygenase
MLPPLPRLSDYDVSPQNGFLPDEIPLDILPDAYYQPWETVVRNFQSLILAKRLRRIIDALPVLETDLLLTEAEWRRAYSILGFMAHGYIWGGEKPTDVSIGGQVSRTEARLIRRIRSFHHLSRYRS